MKRDLADILDVCLRELNRGADLEACLERYPECAAELRPLLEAALWVQGAIHPQLSPRANAQGRRRLLKAVSERKRRKVAPKPGLLRRLGWLVGPPRPRGWALRLALTAVLMVAITLTGVGMARAAAESLPDSPLYTVKLATEQMWLALTPTAAGKATLHIYFAERRLTEMEAMARLGMELDPAILEAMQRETSHALTIGTTSGQEIPTFPEKFTALVERQYRILEEVRIDAPPHIQEVVEEAIEDSLNNKQIVTAASEEPDLLLTPSPTPPPPTPLPTSTATPTAIPTATPVPTEPPRPTATPTATPTPMPTPTVEPTSTPEVAPPPSGPTPLPMGTPTTEPSPTPTVEPTSTPEVAPPPSEPTPLPMGTPTAEPSPMPTVEPTSTPEVAPPPSESTPLTPMGTPTTEPSPTPTVEPTSTPEVAPPLSDPTPPSMPISPSTDYILTRKNDQVDVLPLKPLYLCSLIVFFEEAQYDYV